MLTFKFFGDIVIAAELLRLIRLNFSASIFQEEEEKVKKNPDFLERFFERKTTTKNVIQLS
jgi:hypothetical protein